MQFQTINPATGAVLQTFPPLSDLDLERVLATAHKAYQADWRKRSAADRARMLSKAAAILRERASEFAHILTLEMGKLAMEAQVEVELSASILDYYASRGEGHLKPKPLPDVPNAEVHI